MEAEEARALASSVAAVDATGYENTRSPRYSLIRKASMQWNGMTFPVRVRNISIGGALVETSRGIPDGAQVQLDLPGCGSLGAEVRWAQSEKIGIRFDRPFNLRALGPTQVGGQHAAQQAPVLKPDYLASEENPDSPWAGATERFTPADLRRAGR